MSYAINRARIAVLVIPLTLCAAEHNSWGWPDLAALSSWTHQQLTDLSGTVAAYVPALPVWHTYASTQEFTQLTRQLSGRQEQHYHQSYKDLIDQLVDLPGAQAHSVYNSSMDIAVVPQPLLQLDTQNMEVSGKLIQLYQPLFNDLHHGIHIPDLPLRWGQITQTFKALKETYIELDMLTQGHTTMYDAYTLYVTDLKKNKTITSTLYDKLTQNPDARIMRAHYHLFDSQKEHLFQTPLDNLSEQVCAPVSADLLTQPSDHFVRYYALQQQQDIDRDAARRYRDASNALSRPVSRTIIDWFCAQEGSIPTNDQSEVLIDPGLYEQITDQQKALGLAMEELDNALRPFVQKSTH